VKIYPFNFGIGKQVANYRILTLGHYGGGTRSVAISPNGKLLTSAHGQKTFVWDLATGKQIHAIACHEATKVAFSPDGWTVAIAGYAASSEPLKPKSFLQLVDVETGKVRDINTDSLAEILSIRFCPDGRFL